MPQPGELIVDSLIPIVIANSEPENPYIALSNQAAMKVTTSMRHRRNNPAILRNGDKREDPNNERNLPQKQGVYEKKMVLGKGVFYKEMSGYRGNRQRTRK